MSESWVKKSIPMSFWIRKRSIETIGLHLGKLFENARSNADAMLKLPLCTLMLAVILCAGLTDRLAAESGEWLSVKIGLIGLASQDILNEALHEAQRKHDDGIIIVLDTPGGVLEVTRHMVKQIMESSIPVVVWVGPSGAHAGSAGAFITLSAHVAAMASGTNIGASHPIDGTGRDIESDDLNQKIENDTAAFVEAIAEKRNRNKEMAASFVVNSVSITASEAKSNNVIDLISDDLSSLMLAIDGREVKLAGDVRATLKTKDAKLVEYRKTPRQAFLEILSNPDLFYLLFIAGLIGIGFELTHPGVYLPGVVGGICLILALIATSVLPVNFGAMLLVLASLGFMIAEAFVPSFGVLGIGGAIAFIMGSFLLVDPNNQYGMQVAWSSILPAAIMVLGFVGFIFYLVYKAGTKTAVTGGDTIVGRKAIVHEDFVDGRGQVKVEGEFWEAKNARNEPLTKGSIVKILGRQDLLLLVERDQDW